MDETLYSIEQQHHRMIRKCLGCIPSLIATALRTKDKELREKVLRPLQDGFDKFADELEKHMRTEERLIFPVLKKPPLQEKAALPAGCIEGLEDDHERMLGVLAGFRRLAGNYNVLQKSTDELKELYDQLQLLHADLIEHINFENNVLFKQIPGTPKPGKHP